MKQLIEQLTSNYGISREQATGILTTVSDYVTTEFPAFGNSINLIFNETAFQNNTGTTSVLKEGVYGKVAHFAENHLPRGRKLNVEEIIEGSQEKEDRIF